MKKGNVLIVSPNPLDNGPRMIREIDALKQNYNLYAMGASPPHDNSVTYYPISQIKHSITDKIIWKICKIFSGRIYKGKSYSIEKRFHEIINKSNPDFVILHNPFYIPYFASYPGKPFKIIFNAHEYHPLEFEENKKWMKSWGQHYYYLYKEYLSKVDLLINVCESISEKCYEEFGKKSVVIPNAASYRPELIPSGPFEGRPIRIIHHGAAIPERKIEIMVKAIQMLGENYQLDLMLTHSNQKYYDELLALTAKSNNVKLINPIPFNSIIPFINQYDIGLFNLPPSNFNYKFALPNKLFEFIQARLCIVVSPSPEMAKIVKQYNLGVVSEDFTADAIAEVIKKLTREDIENYKRNNNKVAGILSAETYMEEFLKVMESL